MVTYFSVRLQGIDEPRKIMGLNTSSIMLVPIERGMTFKTYLNPIKFKVGKTIKVGLEFNSLNLINFYLDHGYWYTCLKNIMK